ncbi:solute carrier family 22 member 21 [Plakobranchus ocellatus]|uniref:Solute carrier family 22 member 21 n=1 Tax=Plakobranchus ocellatus TaxID=259542 RepID=A0AAV4DIM0_9GAST|nr:solute carrier family 22 member 21 [Plakobranchus ocellatus]
MEPQDLFGQAFALAETKLEKYLTEGQPWIQFLKDIQFFSPNKIFFVSGAEDVSAIKELENVPEDEIKNYMTKLGSNAVHMSDSSLNPHLFWASVSVDLPKLAALATPLICSTVKLADAERSVSTYNLIVAFRR